MLTFSSAQDSKASLSLEAVENKLEKHQSENMGFAGEIDGTLFWIGKVFFHSCFPIILWNKKCLYQNYFNQLEQQSCTKKQ